MKQRRSHVEVILDVLKAIELGYRAPTRIMYASNTSWRNVKSIFKEVVESGYADFIDNSENDGRTKKIYVLTGKGKRLLRDSSKVFELLEASFKAERLDR